MKPASAGFEALTRTLYRELHHVAAARMSKEQAPQTLQATALVHEAWLRIGGENQPEWVSRAQFFAASAEAMRRILIDRARRRKAVRHGGGQYRVDLDSETGFGTDQIAAAADDDMLLALNEALETLAEGDAQSADLIKLKYFAGMTVGEVAQALEMPKRTVERRLSFARAWLRRELERDLK